MLYEADYEFFFWFHYAAGFSVVTLESRSGAAVFRLGTPLYIDLQHTPLPVSDQATRLISNP